MKRKHQYAAGITFVLMIAAALVFKGQQMWKQSQDAENEKKIAAALLVQNNTTANDQCQEWLDILSIKVDDNNRYVRYRGGTEDDPWGNPIEVIYNDEGDQDTIIVKSKGPDQKDMTDDDIVKKRKSKIGLGTKLKEKVFGKGEVQEIKPEEKPKGWKDKIGNFFNKEE